MIGCRGVVAFAESVSKYAQTANAEVNVAVVRPAITVASCPTALLDERKNWQRLALEGSVAWTCQRKNPGLNEVPLNVECSMEYPKNFDIAVGSNELGNAVMAVKKYSNITRASD